MHKGGLYCIDWGNQGRKGEDDMDEYRGRYEAYGRRGQRQHQEEYPPVHAREAEAPQGVLESFGIGGDWLEEYLPVLLILLGAVGVYLWLGKQNEGLGGLLGGLLGR